MLISLRNVLKYSSRQLIRSVHSSSAIAQIVTAKDVSINVIPAQDEAQKVSKAMKSYMERAKLHDDFMKTQLQDYNIGKRHLANMMGRDPEFFTQQDVDEAIKYLFPSGLYDPRARPTMKHPSEVFPKRKDAEFDITGRPYHSLFYTSKPNYYQVLHEAAVKFMELNLYEDKMINNGQFDRKTDDLLLAGSDWLTKTKLEQMLLEDITDQQYVALTKTLERFSKHPYAFREKDFLMRYRRPLAAQTELQQVPELLRDEAGRPFIEFASRRKWAKALVKVIGQGTGRIEINGQDILYFKERKEKEQVIFPIEFTDMLGKVDVIATVSGGGPAGQAGAIRYGIAICLRSFVDLETMERMRLAGLLSFDPRVKERKKPGQAGAREKFTWKAR